MITLEIDIDDLKNLKDVFDIYWLEVLKTFAQNDKLDKNDKHDNIEYLRSLVKINDALEKAILDLCLRCMNDRRFARIVHKEESL